MGVVCATAAAKNVELVTNDSLPRLLPDEVEPDDEDDDDDVDTSDRYLKLEYKTK